MPRVTIPDIGSLGLNKDMQPHELPVSALSEVQNIRMRDGSAERIYGETPVFTTPVVAPYHVQLFQTANSRFVVHVGTAAAYADDGSTQTNITGTAPTGSAGDRWTGGILNGVLVLNNGIDQPMYWSGDVAANLATLPGWTSTWRCAAMRPFKNYLIGMNWKKNTTYYPHMVKWSSAADPGTVPASWNEADPAVDAGETDLSETPGGIVDGLALGDTFIIYTTDAMYAMSYIGGQYIWQFRKLPGEVGLLARGCVCNIPSGHLVLALGDLVIHSGTGPQSILTGKLRRWLFSQIDENYSDRSFIVSNPALNEAWVCFPEVGQSVCTKVLIWNWSDNTFSLRDLNNVTCGTSGQYEFTSGASWSSDADTWDSDLTSWNKSDIALTQSRFLLGTSTPKLLGIDIGTDFDGITFTAKVERTGLHFDAPDSVKLITAIFPRIEGTTGATVYIQAGGAMDVEGSYTWSDPVPYVIGTTYRADTFASGRFLAYRVYSVDVMEWRIKSIDMEIKTMGMY